MTTDAITTEGAGTSRPRRFLRVFVTTALVLLVIVVAINVVTFSLMLRPENATIVQLMAGWGRSYKPILYDQVQPELVIFGKSIARDAFDPTEIEKVTGLRTFNHAVSGGHAYENRRFAQSAAENENLKAVILNLDSFLEKPGTVKFEYGFDESILNVTATGEQNSGVGIHRLYAATLAGSATGYNLSLLLTLAKEALGFDRRDYLPAYEQMDGATLQRRAERARTRLFPDQPPTNPISTTTWPATIDHQPLADLEVVLDTYCDRSIDIFLYAHPDGGGDCNITADQLLQATMLLKEKQKQCKARFHFYDFQYPNAVTLEGIATPVEKSLYYRPDGHPRPTVGTLMAAKMLDQPLPDGAPDAVEADFGTDLLTEPDPIAWLEPRLARCQGHWTQSDEELIVGKLFRPSSQAAKGN